MMLVWVFAGGGQSEIEGLLPYLRSEFPNCDFKRVTPVNNKDGRKPNKQQEKFKKERSPQGLSGKSLLKEIENKLNDKFRFNDPICDLILIFDDLDYPPKNSDNSENYSQQRHQKFVALLQQVQKKYPKIPVINYVVGFAKPELESWVIANWFQTVDKDPDFRKKSKQIHRLLSKGYNVLSDSPEDFGLDRELESNCKKLSNQYKISFDSPEDFGLNPELASYRKKLSDLIIEVASMYGIRYSKQIHTARFIKQLDSAIAQQKCPEFRKFFVSLSQCIKEAKS